MENQPTTSYQAFMEQYNKNQAYNKEIEETTSENEASGNTSPDFEDEENKNETDLMISKLCRVCGNRGQIYIYSTICDKYLSIPKTRLSKALEVTIADMIEQISSEKVEKTDKLPQFICPHCLSYLQHAYNVRLEIIHTSKNLTEARKIANDESLVLETTNTPSKPLTANQLEIINTNEEIEGDRYFYENFDKKNVKIKIQTPTRNRIDQRKVEEIKCPGCFKKSYGAKSHNEHMNNCLINVLKIFFGEFQLLYKARFEKKITQEEYLINSISLIFNYAKKIQNVAQNDIDVKAISKILPEIPTSQAFSNQQPTFKASTSNNYWAMRTNPSPDDIGYYSNTQ